MVGQFQWRRHGSQWKVIYFIISSIFSGCKLVYFQSDRSGFMFRNRDWLSPVSKGQFSLNLILTHFGCLHLFLFASRSNVTTHQLEAERDGLKACKRQPAYIQTLLNLCGLFCAAVSEVHFVLCQKPLQELRIAPPHNKVLHCVTSCFAVRAGRFGRR